MRSKDEPLFGCQSFLLCGASYLLKRCINSLFITQAEVRHCFPREMIVRQTKILGNAFSGQNCFYFRGGCILEEKTAVIKKPQKSFLSRCCRVY
ncbi:hypothetical protein CEXT_459281 [Caerostris extrusa]|uniref:Uncharacterized protein n=1 Tax=Caerostris extrusa TaxID=172846 RepID=A0AAV4QCH3_CAEEX|nr:hypothetical protein CEXT_459281 [Caerostris extrusa]